MAKVKQVSLDQLAAETLNSAQQFLSQNPTPTRSKTPTKPKSTPKTPVIKGDVLPGPAASGAGYGVRGNIPSIAENDYTQRFEAIQGQLRAERIRQENLKLDKEVQISAGLQNEVQLQATKNLISGEKVVTETVKLNQQQERTSLERVKLQGLQLDTAGEQALLEPKQQLNAIRLEGARIDVAGSRALLEPQRQKWALQLEVAELKLVEMRGQIQRQRAALGANGPVSIEQLD